MSWLQVVFLSIVQGLTEFLPISSSGHLVIFQKVLGFDEPPIFFDVLVHVGTLFSILLYFKKELFQIAKEWNKNLHLFSLLVIGSFPAFLTGLLFEETIRNTFNLLDKVGIFYLITAFLLLSIKLLPKPRKSHFNKLNWQDGLFVGIFQAIALFPGISRSGATIAGGLIRKIVPQLSFRFSFYLAIPAIIGALVLEILKVSSLSVTLLPQGLLGMILAGVTGFLSLKVLEKILVNANLFWFGFYCLALGFLLVFIH